MTKKKTKAVVDLTRRDFLKVAVAAASSVLVAQAVTTGPLSPFGQLKGEQLAVDANGSQTGHAPGPLHWGMVIDLDKCIGCGYCQRACCAVNDVPADEPWNLVVSERTSTGQEFFFTRPCLHCQNAPCVEVCPVQATYHREDGLVVMNYERCIGCRYCQVACPYDARRFNWEARSDENPYIPTWGQAEVKRRPRGVVEKCTFCIHRIDAGLRSGLMPGIDAEATPACVNACPVGARLFGNLNDPGSPISQYISSHTTLRLREDLGTEANVYYVPPKEGL
ncbi:MAG: 4Fe-4S dicluster domain-containing protein [Chloroflexota bacterium]